MLRKDSNADRMAGSCLDFDALLRISRNAVEPDEPVRYHAEL